MDNPAVKELPKLYINWGKPNGDESAVSFLDEDGTIHTVHGLIARLIAEQSKQLTTTQQALDAKQEDLNFIWKWIERASWDKHTSPETAISIIKHYDHAPWYKNRENWDTNHKEYDAEITAFISDRKKLKVAVEALGIIAQSKLHAVDRLDAAILFIELLQTQAKEALAAAELIKAYMSI